MNKKIDREYSTQDRKEMFYLIDNGISFLFAKTDKNGVTTWKFKNTYKRVQKSDYVIMILNLVINIKEI